MNSTDFQMRVVGGSLLIEPLTSRVAKKPADYELGKAFAWVRMFNDMQRPTKWLDPTAKGTSVEFDFIQEQEQYDEAKRELFTYIEDFNVRYPDIGLSIGPDKEATP